MGGRSRSRRLKSHFSDLDIIESNFFVRVQAASLGKWPQDYGNYFLPRVKDKNLTNVIQHLKKVLRCGIIINLPNYLKITHTQ